MHELAPAEVKARVEVAVIRLLDHGTQHDVQVARQGKQVLHGGAVKLDRAVHNQVPQKVPGQAEFGKDEQLDAGGDRPCHPLAVTGEVAIEIARAESTWARPTGSWPAALIPPAGWAGAPRRLGP